MGGTHLSKIDSLVRALGSEVKLTCSDEDILMNITKEDINTLAKKNLPHTKMVIRL